MTIDKQALREEFQYMQDHYSDPADRDRQIIYIAAEALLDELERNQQYIKRRDQENEEIALTVGKLRVELEAEKQRAKDLFMENARLKSGIAGLIHLGIRYADVEVMKIAGDAQLSTPCTDSIINSIATGIRIKGE
ncbi:ead/Ea22-like family protein [Salmonella enterica subsp. enterica]|nr:ead/Ea22-like family protein [Salmonella enterica subsp. enterica serovar Richmond]ECJ3854795.1 ead/Ea22-like family protein [Salmonella enterica subsp. enterica serovar Richmond]EDW0818437.1 ead/Ea22-like family protein [Salmonella enterica subsp. enterica]MIH32218.1 ead/Ea22-like family protein [Salmonella enterica subsp. enterica]